MRLCKKAAAGRKSGKTEQSYNMNCGVEAARQITIQATGKQITEDQLLDRAMDKSWAQRARTREASGGTSFRGRQQILSDQGVDSTLEHQTMKNILQAVAEGKGVMTSHQCGRLWGKKHSGSHVLLVTGIQYDANGKPWAIVTNDTGEAKSCGRRYTFSTFEKSLIKPPFLGKLLFGERVKMNVTKKPIWK